MPLSSLFQLYCAREPLFAYLRFSLLVLCKSFSKATSCFTSESDQQYQAKRKQIMNITNTQKDLAEQGI